MNITVTVEDLSDTIDVHGGGFTVNNLDIHIDESLDPRQKRNIVINEVIEAFCRTWHKDTVDTLVDYICEALDELEE